MLIKFKCCGQLMNLVLQYNNIVMITNDSVKLASSRYTSGTGPVSCTLWLMYLKLPYLLVITLVVCIQCCFILKPL